MYRLVICIFLLLLLHVVAVSVAAPSLKRSLYRSVYAKYNGDIYLAGLFSMQHWSHNNRCEGLIEQDGLQVLAAAAFGLQEVERRGVLSRMGNLKMGMVAIDTCQNGNYALEQSKDFLRFRQMSRMSNSFFCPNSSELPRPREELHSFMRIFAAYGAGNSDVSRMAATYLQLMDMPQISYFSTSPELSDPKRYPTFFRTIPSDFYSLKAILHILRKYGWNYVLILEDDSPYSQRLVETFMALLANQSRLLKDREVVCVVTEKVTIPRTSSEATLEAVFDQILRQTSDNSSGVHVVLSLVTQPVAQDMLQFVQSRPPPPNLIGIHSGPLWIGTDSWVGRDWTPLGGPTNWILKHSLGLVPSAADVPGFWDYYTSRMPSVVDSDPWLARKFEVDCNCQYHNRSLFIEPELEKMRPVSNVVDCQKIERQCGSKIYSKSQPMLYVHYVVDGILAYAYAIQELIPEECTASLNSEECQQKFWNQLNLTNISNQLRNVSFNDSLGLPFRFWKGRDGAPRYSLVYFNESITDWSVVGAVSEDESGRVLMRTDPKFDIVMATNYSMKPCSQPCKVGFARSYAADPTNRCCWKCIDCGTGSIVESATRQGKARNTRSYQQSHHQQVCIACALGSSPMLPNRTVCRTFEIDSINFGKAASVAMVLLNFVGLLLCVVCLVVFLVFWRTPLIRAAARETSLLLLGGTAASLATSIAMLDSPSLAGCGLRWFAPGLCTTLCYSAVLARTSRVARIFAAKPVAGGKFRVPKFISSFSQVNIILLITLAEAAILITVYVTVRLSGQEPVVIINTALERYRDCSPAMDTSKILLIFLLPVTLLLGSTIFAFRIRKVPDGYNETKHLNFMNFANCVVFFSCILLHQVLHSPNKYSVLPLALMLTLGAMGILLGMFANKVYLVLCRPNKNTMAGVLGRTADRSMSSSGTMSMQHLDHIRCRYCNNSLTDSINENVINTAANAVWSARSQSSPSARNPQTSPSYLHEG